MIEKDTCVMYQLYFYVNLFSLLKSSSILKEKDLNKKTIDKFLNEILTINKEANEDRIKIFVDNICR